MALAIPLRDSGNQEAPGSGTSRKTRNREESSSPERLKKKSKNESAGGINWDELGLSDYRELTDIYKEFFDAKKDLEDNRLVGTSRGNSSEFQARRRIHYLKGKFDAKFDATLRSCL